MNTGVAWTRTAGAGQDGAWEGIVLDNPLALHFDTLWLMGDAERNLNLAVHLGQPTAHHGNRARSILQPKRPGNPRGMVSVVHAAGTLGGDEEGGRREKNGETAGIHTAELTGLWSFTSRAGAWGRGRQARRAVRKPMGQPAAEKPWVGVVHVRLGLSRTAKGEGTGESACCPPRWPWRHKSRRPLGRGWTASGEGSFPQEQLRHGELGRWWARKLGRTTLSTRRSWPSG